jgi:hypothetical protein
MRDYKKDLPQNDTTQPNRVDTNKLKPQEEMIQKEDNHVAASPRLKAAYLQVLLRKRALRNPRYRLLIRRVRLAAYCASRDLEPKRCLIDFSEDIHYMNTADTSPK